MLFCHCLFFSYERWSLERLIEVSSYINNMMIKDDNNNNTIIVNTICNSHSIRHVMMSIPFEFTFGKCV